jgi:hypothetical protein
MLGTRWRRPTRVTTVAPDTPSPCFVTSLGSFFAGNHPKARPFDRMRHFEFSRHSKPAAGALIVALPFFATSNARRSRLMETLKNPFGYVLAPILTGYYLLATAAFQLAPVAEVALLLSTPPLFVLALRRARGDGPTALELFGTGLAVAGIALILGPRLTLAKRFGNRRLVGNVLAVRRY